MSDPKKRISKKKGQDKPDTSNSQTYLAVGAAFFVIGVALLMLEATRISGMSFTVLGATFFILGQQEDSKRKK